MNEFKDRDRVVHEKFGKGQVVAEDLFNFMGSELIHVLFEELEHIVLVNAESLKSYEEPKQDKFKPGDKVLIQGTIKYRTDNLDRDYLIKWKNTDTYGHVGNFISEKNIRPDAPLTPRPLNEDELTEGQPVWIKASISRMSSVDNSYAYSRINGAKWPGPVDLFTHISELSFREEE